MINSVVIILVFFIWFGLYLTSVKKREKAIAGFAPSIEMTNLLKGLACLIIALHHYSLIYLNQNTNGGIPVEAIGKLGGTFSLVIFLFLSGYGITLSEMSKSNNFLIFLNKRMLKIYKPLLLVCFISFILYSAYGVAHIPVEVVEKYRLSDAISIIGQGDSLVYNILYIFGFVHLDWYVVATLAYYLIFYLSFHYPIRFSTNRKLNCAIMMVAIMVIYYIITYLFIGPSKGHYYRNTWAFLFGVLVALSSKSNKMIVIALPLLLLATLIFNQFTEGIIYTTGSILSICFLFIMFRLDKYFTAKSNLLLYLGSISYFVYLSHLRIVYSSLWFFGKENAIILFVFCFLLVAIALKYVYNLTELSTYKNKK